MTATGPAPAVPVSGEPARRAGLAPTSDQPQSGESGCRSTSALADGATMRRGLRRGARPPRGGVLEAPGRAAGQRRRALGAVRAARRPPPPARVRRLLRHRERGLQDRLPEPGGQALPRQGSLGGRPGDQHPLGGSGQSTLIRLATRSSPETSAREVR